MKAGNNAIRNIEEGDFIVIDKAREPGHGSLIVAEWDGGFLLRRLHNRLGVTLLVADNPGYPNIEIPDGGLFVWGVVAGVVRKPKLFSGKYRNYFVMKIQEARQQRL
jgi:DNA polymerase V